MQAPGKPLGPPANEGKQRHLWYGTSAYSLATKPMGQVAGYNASVPQTPPSNVHQMSTLEHFMNRPAGPALMTVQEAHMLVQGSSYAQQTSLVLMDQTKQALAIASEV